MALDVKEVFKKLDEKVRAFNFRAFLLKLKKIKFQDIKEKIKTVPKKAWLGILVFFVIIFAIVHFLPTQESAGIDDLKSFIGRVEQKIIVGPNELPDAVDFEIQNYQPIRDPFSVFELALDESDAALGKTGIEAFPINSLKLVGVISIGDSHWGIIETPSGEIYRVSTGDKIGQNDGSILKIDSKELIVLEDVYKKGIKTRKVVFVNLEKGES